MVTCWLFRTFRSIVDNGSQNRLADERNNWCCGSLHNFLDFRCFVHLHFNLDGRTFGFPSRPSSALGRIPIEVLWRQRCSIRAVQFPKAHTNFGRFRTIVLQTNIFCFLDKVCSFWKRDKWEKENPASQQGPLRAFWLIWKAEKRHLLSFRKLTPESSIIVLQRSSRKAAKETFFLAGQIFESGEIWQLTFLEPEECPGLYSEK